MEIKETGKYKLDRDFITRNTISVATIPKGTVIEITRIDFDYHKVLGDKLLDWQFWNMPVTKL